MVGFRYLGHVSSKFLSTIFLDRGVQHTPNGYFKLFNNGVGVCLLTWDQRKGEYVPALLNNEASRAGPGALIGTDEQFKPYKGYKYPEKSRPPGFVDGLNFRGVTSWVEHLAESHEEPSVGASQIEPVPSSGLSASPLDEGAPEASESPGILRTRTNSLIPTDSEALDSEVEFTETHSSSTRLSEDPFLGLYMKAKIPFMERISPRANSPAKDMTREKRVSPGSSIRSTRSVKDLGLQVSERENRKFHNTMRQKAGSRLIGPKYHSTMSQGSEKEKGDDDSTTTETPNSIVLFGNLPMRRSLRSELVPGLNQSLVEALEPLRAYQGTLTFKAQLGRFCFMKVNKSYVLSDPEGGPQYREPAAMKNQLDAKHLDPSTLWFTPILTTDASDADILAEIKEPDGEIMWKPDSRRTLYVFHCASLETTGQIFNFRVEVDSDTFTYSVHLEDKNPTRFPVHCLKRYWDFQLTLSATPNLKDEIHDNFVKDLVDSLTVT